MNDKEYNTGLTFGAFEILNFGHLRLLQRAKELCKVLIVCVSDDQYIFYHKEYWPVIELKHRMALVKGLRCVDLVDVQSKEFGKKEAIQKYNPDILVVGNDWHPKTYTGEGLGVKVCYLNYTKGISSTIIKRRIKGCQELGTCGII